MMPYIKVWVIQDDGTRLPGRIAHGDIWRDRQHTDEFPVMLVKRDGHPGSDKPVWVDKCRMEIRQDP